MNELEVTKQRVNAGAMEAMRQLHGQIPWGAQVTLPNGRTGVLKQWIEPRFNDNDGKPEFGFDIHGDGWHLEYMVRQTGWGGRP